MKTILDYNSSHTLVPILMFYMEENYLEDVRRAIKHLRNDLNELEAFLDE